MMTKRDVFAELLGRLGSDDEVEPVRPHPDAVIMDLREICARYVAGCPFKVGDIVTVRANHNLRGEGEPVIVVEVRSEPIFQFTVEASDAHAHQAWGARIDMRVAELSRGTWIMHWVESWQFAPFIPA